MLPKNSLKNLRNFLKKQKTLWLREDQPEDEVTVKHSGGRFKRACCSTSADRISLETFLRNQEQFKSILTKAIGNFDKKNEKVHEYAEIYKKALISKQVFSNLFHRRTPSKDTVILLAFGLEYTLQEAEELLKHAGYFLGDCIKRDMIFKFCFENETFNIRDVNKLLKQEGERLLKSSLFA